MAAAAVKLQPNHKRCTTYSYEYLLSVLLRKLEALKSYNFNWNSCIWKVVSHPRPVYEHFKDKAVWAKLQPEPDNDQESIQ